jgi:hypothetical protein
VDLSVRRRRGLLRRRLHRHLIAPDAVLTAAHCVEQTLTGVAVIGVRHRFGDVTVHPLWDGHADDGEEVLRRQLNPAEDERG